MLRLPSGTTLAGVPGAHARRITALLLTHERDLCPGVISAAADGTVKFWLDKGAARAAAEAWGEGPDALAEARRERAGPASALAPGAHAAPQGGRTGAGAAAGGEGDGAGPRTTPASAATPAHDRQRAQTARPGTRPGTALNTADYDEEDPDFDLALHYTFVGHTAPVTALAFHPFLPATVISASEDQTLRIWDLSIGDCILTVSVACSLRGFIPVPTPELLVGYDDCGLHWWRINCLFRLAIPVGQRVGWVASVVAGVKGAEVGRERERERKAERREEGREERGSTPRERESTPRKWQRTQNARIRHTRSNTAFFFFPSRFIGHCTHSRPKRPGETEPGQRRRPRRHSSLAQDRAPAGPCSARLQPQGPFLASPALQPLA